MSLSFIEVKGDDPDRCVFKTTNNDPNYYKLYFEADAYQAFQREYFVTQAIAKSGMSNVVQHEGGELQTSDDLRNAFIKTNGACTDKIRKNPEIPHFITRNVGRGTETLASWLQNRNGPISAEVVQTFAFQLIHIVSQMHSQLGVQHNDIYELNIMVREIRAGEEEIVEVVVGNDVFKVPLKQGHLKVFMFDFGSARVQREPGNANNDNQWEQASDVTFIANNPPEVLYTKSHREKGPETDMWMIGHVLLSMLAHGHHTFKYKEYMGVHLYDVKAKGADDMGFDGKTLGIMVPNDENPVVVNWGLKPTNQDGINKLHKLAWLNLIALDTMLRGYAKASKPPVDITVTKASGVDDFYTLVEIAGTASGPYGLLSKTLTAYRKKYAQEHFNWLKEVCNTQHPHALALLRRLMAFSPAERRAFSFPGSSNCLMGALFHPYFASLYQGMATSVTPNLLFNPPLVYNSDAVATNSITKGFKAQEDLFYGEMGAKYLRDFLGEPAATAMAGYLVDKTASRFDNISNSEKIHMLAKVYPGVKMGNKAWLGARMVALAALIEKVPAMSIADYQAKVKAAASAAAAAAAAEQERQRKEQERVAAEEEAKRKAQEASVLKAQQEKDAKERAAAEAKALADAQALANAKTKAEQDAAAKKVAEDARIVREAKEKEERDKAAAEQAAQAKAQAEAEAAEQKRQAEEADRAAEAAKALEEAAQKQKEEAAKAVFTTSNGSFTLEEQNVLWLMRRLGKENTKEALQQFETTHGSLESVFKRAYDAFYAYLAKEKALFVVDYPGSVSVKTRSGEERASLFNRGRFIIKEISSNAIDIMSLMYLVSQKKTSPAEIATFFDGDGDPIAKVANNRLEQWINTQMGAFLDANTKEPLRSTVAPQPVPESDTSSEGTSSEPAPSPGGKSTDKPSPVPVPIPDKGQQGLKTTPQGVLAALEVQKSALRTLVADLSKGDPLSGAEGAVIDQIKATVFGTALRDMSEVDGIYYIRRKMADGAYEYPDFAQLNVAKWQWIVLLAAYYKISEIYAAKLKDENRDFTADAKTIIQWLGTYADNGKRKGGITSSDETKKKFKKDYLRAQGFIDTNIAQIQSQLESVEHLQLDSDTINEELYEPLKASVVEFPHLEKVASHLGLECDHFMEAGAKHGIDMHDAHNQTRYLHTLSVLAGAMKQTDSDSAEEIERCFVEWPPKVPYKAGQVNEI